MLRIDGQIHPDTLVMRMHNYVIEVSNNVIVNRSTLCNSVSVHIRSTASATGSCPAGACASASQAMPR